MTMAPAYDDDLAVVDQILSRCVRRGDCWVWTGARSSNGYGRVQYRGTVQPTHRVIYTIMVADIPDGLEIDHVREWGCTHRRCCNWLHMEPVTPQVNGKRSRDYQIAQTRTHCPRGHEFTEENTLIRRCGRRVCRTCRRLRDRTYSAGGHMRRRSP